KWNRERQLEKALAEHPPNWVFEKAPPDRLALYRDHVSQTIRRIRNDGAQPILVTYAIGALHPPRPDDTLFLEDLRTHFPRSAPQTLTEFHALANRTLRELAKELNVPLIDADKVLSGRAELFADLVHFNNQGSEVMAQLLVEELIHLPLSTTKHARP